MEYGRATNRLQCDMVGWQISSTGRASQRLHLKMSHYGMPSHLHQWMLLN